MVSRKPLRQRDISNLSEGVYQTFCVTVVLIVAVVSAIPLLYVLAISLTSDAEYYATSGLILFPKNPTFLAYENILFKNNLILHSLWINIARTVCGTVLSLVNTIVLGYVISREDLPGVKPITIMLLIAMLFSGGLIPSFLTITSLGLYDTFAVLFITNFVSVWNTLIFRQFFIGLPKEMEESARLDGAGEFVVMTRIIVPMSKPVVAAISLFTAVAIWNDWFGALIYIKDNNLMPLPLIMHNMFRSSLDITDYAGISVTAITTKMAVTVIGAMPILMVYPFLQKYFVKGIYTGAVKG